MRSVGLSDLDLATRAILMSPRVMWTTAAQTLIEDAHTADLWRKRYGTAHPNGGTGSLYAQASLHSSAASSDCNTQYCTALATLLLALGEWRQRDHRET